MDAAMQDKTYRYRDRKEELVDMLRWLHIANVMFSEDKHVCGKKSQTGKKHHPPPLNWQLPAPKPRRAHIVVTKEKQRLTQYIAESNTATGKVLLFTDCQHHDCTALMHSAE